MKSCSRWQRSHHIPPTSSLPTHILLHISTIHTAEGMIADTVDCSLFLPLLSFLLLWPVCCVSLLCLKKKPFCKFNGANLLWRDGILAESRRKSEDSQLVMCYVLSLYVVVFCLLLCLLFVWLVRKPKNERRKKMSSIWKVLRSDPQNNKTQKKTQTKSNISPQQQEHELLLFPQQYLLLFLVGCEELRCSLFSWYHGSSGFQWYVWYVPLLYGVCDFFSLLFFVHVCQKIY